MATTGKGLQDPSNPFLRRPSKLNVSNGANRNSDEQGYPTAAITCVQVSWLYGFMIFEAAQSQFMTDFVMSQAAKPNSGDHLFNPAVGKASIGAVVFVNHGLSKCAALKWPETGMYWSKDAGQNSIMIHEVSAKP